MKAQFHAINLESVNVPHPKVLKIGYQLSVDPDGGASVALPRRIGFEHEFVAVPSIP